MTERRPNWHDDVFFGLHYDLHANRADTELGREISYDHIRERLERIRPDWVHCDCKGHAGYTSWPTTIGSTAPGMIHDQLRVYRDVTRDMGINLNMHYSGVWDTRAIEVHPEWGRIDADGARDPDMTCRSSSYDDELMIPQMLELIDNYDVDGFWVDGENWASRPCWCERCSAEYTRRTGNTSIPRSAADDGWTSWLQFHRDLFIEHVRHYTDAVHAHKPTCTVVSNWMYTARQPEAIDAPIDYISGDYDWNFGANRAAIEGRVIDSRDRSWDLMAWGFTKTNPMQVPPHWVMKPVIHLQQELAEVVALGGAMMIYNTPQRTGWLTGWHQDTMAAAARFCRERQDACWKSRPVPEAAVLHLTDHYYATNEALYSYGPGGHPVEGALQVLLETHRSTDVLTRDAALRRMDEYKLIVVPEQTHLSDEIVARLRTAAEHGAFVILSGPRLAHDHPDLVGAQPQGKPTDDAKYTYTFLETRGHAVPVSAPWQPVAPAADTEVWAYRLAHHDPEKDRTDQALVTFRAIGQGGIVAIHGPIFYDYFQGHYPLLRQFFGDLVARLPIAWTATVEASPRLELILRQKAGRTVINLVNRGAAEMLSPQRVMVEELAPVHDVRVRLRRDRVPTSVSIIPAGDSFEWSYDDGSLDLNIPRVDIHTVVVVE